MSTPQSYVIRGGSAGRDRLAVLSRVLAPTTGSLLDLFGVREGMRCLDVGCGGGDVTRELARRVGPTGQVVGIDQDAAILELARQETEQAKLTQTEYRQGDARAVRGQFDLVYARFLLSHLPHPESVLATLAEAAREGGLVAVEDVEFAGHLCHPPCRAFTRYIELYREVVRRRGGDADLGPKVPAMMHALGLDPVEVRAVQPMGLRGEAKSLASLTLENIADALVAEALTTTEVTDLLTELRQAERRPDTLMSLPRIFQVWGCRPACR